MPFPQLGAVGAFRSDDDLADQCLVYAVGGIEDFTNLVNGTPPTRGGTGAGLASLNRDHGSAFSTNGSANGFITFGTAADFTVGTGDFAFAMLVDQGSLINSFGAFITGGLELLFGGAAGTRGLRLSGGASGTGTRGGLNDGLAHMAVFSRSNGVGSYWVDGALVSSATMATSVTATSGLTIGKRGSTATYYAVPATAMVGYWSRALSNDEALRLADDPFLLSRPKTTLLRSAAGATNYTLTAAVGAFTLSGQDANLARGYVVAADAGAFALSGQDATFNLGKGITADVGTFTLAGQDAVLRASRSFAANVGTFTLAGQGANLTTGKTFPASAGAFTVSGQDAGLTIGRTLQVSVGTFDLSGQDAALTLVTASGSRTLTAETGTFALTGIAATLTRSSEVIYGPPRNDNRTIFGAARSDDLTITGPARNNAIVIAA